MRSGARVIAIVIVSTLGALSTTLSWVGSSQAAEAGLRAPRADRSGEWAAVAVGTWHSCAIRVNGTLWCWGANKSGELGTGGDKTPQFAPVKVGTRADWVSVMAGHNSGCAIPTDGTLWCWGRGDHGQLGDGQTAIVRAPEQIGSETDWSAVSGSNGGVGYYTDAHTCGLRIDGTAWCWGQNDLGQVGNGTKTDQLTPAQVGASRSWTSVSAGNNASCGTRLNGSLWCWGSGDLGNGATETQLTPVRIGSGSTWESVSAGGDHICATQVDGTLWCWGSNSVGGLGDGTITDRLFPTQVGTSTSWASVSSGSASTCAVKLGGTAWCWGWNGDGQLGIGSNEDSLVPVKVVSGPNQWSSNVVTRYVHACGLGADHTLWCWGHNQYGEVGSPTGRHARRPVQVVVP